MTVNRTVSAAGTDELPTIEETAAPLDYHGGFFDVYWDAESGKLLLKIDRWGDEFLVLDALASGLGSNPVGLDRGQLGRERLCSWRRVGRRVFLQQTNTRFRADGADAVEQRAVQDSFAPSILWSGPIVAADPTNASVLVDITDLVVADRHDVIGTLQSTGQGNYGFRSDRSSVLPDYVKAFPNNIELEAALTFAAEKPGRQVGAVAATGEAFTIRQRISLIRLPDLGFQTRAFHPAIGSFSVDYADYAAPLDRSMHRRLMTRHRLSQSEPIVYYVDPAAPEPVRSALVEGASWWAEAFAKAGFPNGFKVEVAPPNMDPLDVRYNFIQWVHRQTRGWSYGASVVDPRTGEIIKGHVSLGSLRVRQDRLLIDNLTQTFQDSSRQSNNQNSNANCAIADADFGLDAMFATDTGVAPTGPSQSTSVALARVRQLSAHEVGHTLGLAHNFAASTYGDRASVMDYPAPRIQVTEDGELDFSQAYGVGVGDWDRFCIRAMYGSLGDDPDSKLNEIAAEAIDNDWVYLSDSDARPSAASDPRANLWDDGEDPIESLRQALKVRSIGLTKFGHAVLLPGETAGDLRRYFAPLYFHHRYQVDAVVKYIGGVKYAYHFGNSSDAKTSDVAAAEQQRAVQTLIETLQPSQLAIDQAIAQKLIPAGASATAWSNEYAQGRTSPIFDSLSIVETAAEITLSGMLNPQRLGRLAVQRTRDDANPGIDLVLDPLKQHAISLLETKSNPGETLAARRIFATIVSSGIDSASQSEARQDVRAALRQWLTELSGDMKAYTEAHPSDHDAEISLLQQRIQQFVDRPDLAYPATSIPTPPPGSPIGSGF
ncbi:zinc-dependent metalloprotease [Stieleria sp. JC731]|uniref:zinc-dependent metalloprotease n=1 Tax=Pirellulaceae TaxID=2691357 RepID=UPI001E40BAC5|nr:zinc-dependent metalloprotease [Stieleria sp. JC731]MCC9600714.1 zinc-dependent metalloprotease [Stieleria sp. JC731]